MIPNRTYKWGMNHCNADYTNISAQENCPCFQKASYSNRCMYLRGFGGYCDWVSQMCSVPKVMKADSTAPDPKGQTKGWVSYSEIKRKQLAAPPEDSVDALTCSGI